MRLLIYGGNLYEERRRIGTWPKLITDEILQERYALSERKPAFGVGLLDDTPFIIFRKIQPHKDRSYPLTVLFDPGTLTWETYQWNGAHLLHALFIEDNSPGQKLLHEAEKFHSEEDLERLLQELGYAELPPVSPSEDEEKVWQWWFASLASEEPVIASPDGDVVGLNSRPLVVSMAQLMARVPAPWRCGKGWLIGGHRGQVKSFGVHFVFDDGKAVEDKVKAREQSLEMLRESQEQFAAYEAVHSQNSNELTEFFEHPLWQWERKHGYTTRELFSDLRLLESLSTSSFEQHEERLDEVLKSVIKRLEDGKGPLYEPICVAASKLTQGETEGLTPGQTLFQLYYAYENSQGISEELAKRLDPDAAIQFFVARSLYPTAAQNLMPPEVRVEVCRKVMEKEENYEKIPHILNREIEVLAQTSSPQSLEDLVRFAVKLSTQSASSLKALWLSSMNDQRLGAWLKIPLRDAARAALMKELNTSNGDSAEEKTGVGLRWLEDYLRFDEDIGGGWLAAEDIDRESIARLVGLISQAAESQSPSGFSVLAQHWLSALAGSKLRSSIPVKAKHRIVEAFLRPNVRKELGRTWDVFKGLKKFFEGDVISPGPKSLKYVRERPEEQPYLLGELRELADLVSQEQHEQGRSYPPPNALSLWQLFDQEYHSEAATIMLPLCPDLTQPAAAVWLKGWLRFSQVEDAEAARASWEKYQQEWVRFLLESDIPIVEDEDLLSAELLANFAQERLNGMFDELLFGGGADKNKQYSRRLAEVLKVGSKVPSVLLRFQDSFGRFADQPTVEVFLRRYTKTVEKLGKILTVEQQVQLVEAMKAYRKKEMEIYQKKVRDFFLAVPMSDFLPEFPQLKSRTERDIFMEAVGAAFTQIIEIPQAKSDFLRRFANDKKSRKLVSDNLPSDSLRETFELLILEEQQRQLRRDIYAYLYEGELEDDNAYRETLEKRLLKEEDAVKEAVRSIINKSLNDPSLQAIFKRRFMHVPNGDYRYRASELKVISLIFNCLEWESRKAILIFLYEADRELFKDMMSNVVLHLERGILQSVFHIALLQFIKTKHPIAVSIRLQLEINQPSKQQHLKTLLNKVPNPELDELFTKAPSQEIPEEDKRQPPRKKGVFKRLVSAILGEEEG